MQAKQKSVDKIQNKPISLARVIDKVIYRIIAYYYCINTLCVSTPCGLLFDFKYLLYWAILTQHKVIVIIKV